MQKRRNPRNLSTDIDVLSFIIISEIWQLRESRVWITYEMGYAATGNRKLDIIITYTNTLHLNYRISYAMDNLLPYIHPNIRKNRIAYRAGF